RLRDVLLTAPLLYALGSGDYDPMAHSWDGTDLAACNGAQQELGRCQNLRPCSPVVHCEWSDWEDWYYAGGCIGLCFRHREVRQFSSELGNSCSGAKVASKDCIQDPRYFADCGPNIWAGPSAERERHFVSMQTDCIWGDWSPWGACSRDCGGGERSRERDIKAVPENGGAPCQVATKEEVQPCGNQPCREICRDGVWAPWQEWQPCPVTCGASFQLRRRQ
ncbi:unnamed protein product, partial [Polarella glacialis]